MERLSTERRSKVESLLLLIEKVLRSRYQNESYLKDEIEKHFSYIIQGKDDMNPYDRRKSGVTDEDWELKIKECREALNLIGDDDEKIINY